MDGNVPEGEIMKGVLEGANELGVNKLKNVLEKSADLRDAVRL